MLFIEFGKRNTNTDVVRWPTGVLQPPLECDAYAKPLPSLWAGGGGMLRLQGTSFDVLRMISPTRFAGRGCWSLSLSISDSTLLRQALRWTMLVYWDRVGQPSRPRCCHDSSAAVNAAPECWLVACNRRVRAVNCVEIPAIVVFQYLSSSRYAASLCTVKWATHRTRLAQSE